MNDPNPSVSGRADVASGHPGSRRRRGFMALGLLAILAAVGYGSYWLLSSRFYESTDDAYVNDDLVQITSEVPGTVMVLSVDDTQGVRRGQTLLELDPADAEVARSNAEARLAGTVRQVRTLFATAEQL